MARDFYESLLAPRAPYVIAELGSNHNGDMALARRLIDAAAEAGADCVKFQSWTKESIFSRKVYEENRFLADDYRSRSDFTLEQIVEKFAISEAQLLDMKAHADSAGIACTSTPFSPREVDFLVDRLEAPFVKVASMDVNNLPLLRHVARKQRPVVLSVGLSELWEVDQAVRAVEAEGNRRIVLLHCVSLYPPKDEDVNLRNMETLRRIYPYPVGFSDHTIGSAIPLAAAALGATVIEKHFTLDREMFGWDHKVSADPPILREICAGARRISAALGSLRIQCEEPPERKAAFRRSVVTKRALAAGERIAEADLDFKRPGTGIPPAEAQYVVGRRVKVAVEADQVLTWELLD
jgi:N-acetylneuraminate synthase